MADPNYVKQMPVRRVYPFFRVRVVEDGVPKGHELFKVADSHLIDLQTGKEVILALNTPVTILGRVPGYYPIKGW